MTARVEMLRCADGAVLHAVECDDVAEARAFAAQCAEIVTQPGAVERVRFRVIDDATGEVWEIGAAQ